MGSSDSVVVGITLLAVVPIVLALEGPISMPGRFDGAFWGKPVDEKLDRIAADRSGWRRIGLSWVPTVALMLGGLAAFTHQLGSTGSDAWAWVALGIYLVGAIAWLLGVLLQTTVGAAAAQIRAATGVTPEWLAGIWGLAWWCEVSFVVLANVAAVLWGVAILETGYPSAWMGWTAIGIGAVILAGAAVTRDVFPHLGIAMPLVTGVALLLA